MGVANPSAGSRPQPITQSLYAFTGGAAEQAMSDQTLFNMLDDVKGDQAGGNVFHWDPVGMIATVLRDVTLTGYVTAAVDPLPVPGGGVNNPCGGPQIITDPDFLGIGQIIAGKGLLFINSPGSDLTIATTSFSPTDPYVYCNRVIPPQFAPKGVTLQPLWSSTDQPNPTNCAYQELLLIATLD